MTTITLTNSFHGTSTTIRPRGDEVTGRAIRAAADRLCGIPSCMCGGIRGIQEQADGTVIDLEWIDDETVRLFAS